MCKIANQNLHAKKTVKLWTTKATTTKVTATKKSLWRMYAADKTRELFD